ncbi:MAG: glycosyltransferase family 2 protein [Turicibacter sanguinis]|uniref:glycosyltransferase family 2 protein n=1 Tax=Turicibacter sanguinis TaxID=154288 RepID=UPI002F945EB3
MNKNSEISVIVPIYNGEKYIKRCLQSLLNTAIKYDLIVVNDGSSDNSDEIIRCFETKDKRIKYVKSPNLGASHARNLGLKCCSTKFVMFCDCDDEFEPGTIDRINEIILKYNWGLIEFNRIDISNGKYGKKMMSNNNISILTKNDYIENYFSLTNSSCYSVINKIYHTSIIKDNCLQFNEQLRYSEDLEFNLKYLNYSHDSLIMQVPFVSYYRYCNQNSIVFTSNDNYFEMETEHIEDLYNSKLINNKIYSNLIIHFAFISLDRIVRGYDEFEKKDAILKIYEIKKDCDNKNIKLFYSIKGIFIFYSILLNVNIKLFYYITSSLFYNKRKILEKRKS